MATWLPILAIVLSAFTFLASQREAARRAKVDYVVGLEKRVEGCENDRERLQKDLHDQRELNLDLMQRVFRLEEKMLAGGGAA